jgi:hypothetical protein
VIDAPRLQLRSILECAKKLDPEANVVTVKNTLPAYLDGDVRLFNFAEDGINSHTLEWFFAIQYELIKDWNARESKGNLFCVTGRIFSTPSSKATCMACACLRPNQCMTTSRPRTLTSWRGSSQTEPAIDFPFCALENDRIDLLWVAERMRRKGLATLLVSLLKQRGVSGADYIDCVPGALLFWERVGAVTGPRGLAQVHF